MPRARRRLSQAHLLVGLLPAFALAGCSAKITAPPEPPVAVRLGDEAFAAQDYEGAIRDYNSYLAQVDRGEYSAHVHYKSALASYRLGDHAGALSTLDTLEARYRGSRWVQVDALRGDAERELGRPVAALTAWDGAWSLANDIERPKVRSRIANLARTATTEDLRRARGEVRSNEVIALLDAELAQRAAPPIQEPLLGETQVAAAAPAPGQPANLIDALRSVPAERGAAATPGYDRRDGIQRGPNRHPAWRDEAASQGEPTRGERVVLDSEEDAAPPTGLAKLDIPVETTIPAAPATAPVVAEPPAAAPDARDAGERSRLERLDGLDDRAAAASETAVLADADDAPPAPRTQLQRIDGLWGEPLHEP